MHRKLTIRQSLARLWTKLGSPQNAMPIFARINLPNMWPILQLGSTVAVGMTKCPRPQNRKATVRDLFRLSSAHRRALFRAKIGRNFSSQKSIIAMPKWSKDRNPSMPIRAITNTKIEASACCPPGGGDQAALSEYIEQCRAKQLAYVNSLIARRCIG